MSVKAELIVSKIGTPRGLLWCTPLERARMLCPDTCVWSEGLNRYVKRHYKGPVHIRDGSEEYMVGDKFDCCVLAFMGWRDPK